jgi:hypothetical protein
MMGSTREGALVYKAYIDLRQGRTISNYKGHSINGVATDLMPV